MEVEPKVPADDGEIRFSEALHRSRLAGQIEVQRGIPRLAPRTEDELPARPPPRSRYRLDVGSVLTELAGTRELLQTLVERDLRLRYRQSLLGGAWALLQPILLMVVFSFAFGRVARVGSEGVPYPLFVYSALVPWAFFSGSVGYGIGNIVTNAPIIRKVYLAREVIPLSSVVSAGVDFAFSSLILLAMLLAYGNAPHLTWLAFPLLVLILTEFAVATTLAASLVTVYFRDTRFAVPTLLQLALFATPVVYPMERVLGVLPGGWRGAYAYLNPLAPLLDGFREVLVHGRWPEWGPLGAGAAMGAVFVVLAYTAYKRLDPTFADVI